MPLHVFIVYRSGWRHPVKASGREKMTSGRPGRGPDAGWWIGGLAGGFPRENQKIEGGGERTSKTLTHE